MAVGIHRDRNRHLGAFGLDRLRQPFDEVGGQRTAYRTARVTNASRCRTARVRPSCRPAGPQNQARESVTTGTPNDS